MNDIVRWRRLDVGAIQGIDFDLTYLNLLAMIFFVSKYADDNARAKCTFVQFPPTKRVP